jgi:hypothetical protein
MLYTDSLHTLSLVEKTRVEFTGNYYLFFDRTQSRRPIEFVMKREELETLQNQISELLVKTKKANIENIKRVQLEIRNKRAV